MGIAPKIPVQISRKEINVYIVSNKWGIMENKNSNSNFNNNLEIDTNSEVGLSG